MTHVKRAGSGQQLGSHRPVEAGQVAPHHAKHHSHHAKHHGQTGDSFEPASQARSRHHRPPNPNPNPNPNPGPTPNPNPGPTPSPGGNLPGPHPVTLPNVHVPAGETEIEAVVTIDRYQGLIHGRNGTHEVAYGHITLINAAGDKSIVGTEQVELAMNVASAKDPAGLPQEIPLKAGDQIEVEGIYIPSQVANGPNAVLHFTHSPDGYVITPDGKKYS